MNIPRLEASSVSIRLIIQHYSVYKSRLDYMLRLKRLNNYMALSETASRDKSAQEISGYYKTRLYQYTHRLGELLASLTFKFVF